MSVGAKVARWRAERKLTEREAAKLIGVSQPTLRAVERGEVKRIGLAVAQAFVDACDGVIAIDDFLTPPTRKRRRRRTPAAA